MENNPVFVVLAGGKSCRMGAAKGLLRFNKTFWILEQLYRISLTSVKSVYIGLGHKHQHYFDAIDWFQGATQQPFEFLGLSVNIIINNNPELGSFSTLQNVINKIPSGTDILINPIDTPLLNKNELQTIIDKSSLIVIPNYKGKNGHPIKLEYEFWHTLKSLNPLENDSRLDVQVKKITSSEISQIMVSEDTILKNMNTSSEWKLYLNSIKQI